jgi:hypothetical protein
MINKKCKECKYYRHEVETDFNYCLKTPFDLKRLLLLKCPAFELLRENK